MTNSLRKRILILVIVFIITLSLTRIYSHVDSKSNIFKNENSNENITNDISNITYGEESELSLTTDMSFTIITGASKNHFCPLKSFLYAIHKNLKGTQKKARIIVYDLGLSNKQKKQISHLQKEGYLTKLKLFDWSKYPSFWNIRIARGEYAWKPGMIYEISQEYPGVIIWLDSGTKVLDSFFENIDQFLDEFDGFVSPNSPGIMSNWTHPGVYDYFNDDHTKYDDLPNCNGASIVFDTKRTQSLINIWYECALDKNCIAPPGSSRKNHRQDQALLTYFAAKEGRICDQDRDRFGFQIHDDGKCKLEINEYEAEHKNLKKKGQ